MKCPNCMMECHHQYKVSNLDGDSIECCEHCVGEARVEVQRQMAEARKVDGVE